MLFKIGDWTSFEFPCEIVEELSGGNMAELYVARLKATNHRVVVKASAMEAGLYREARLLSHLWWNGVPRMFGYFREPERSYYIMSWHEGSNLERYVKNEGRMALKWVRHIGVELCRILIYLHSEKSVVHNDLKPANILFSEKGEVALVDFGLAEGADFLMPSYFERVRFQGTPGYAAPECWHREKRQLFPATDIFALGATLFYLLEGKEPRECYGRFVLSDSSFENLQKKNSWQAVLDKCCALDIRKRYQSTAQVYEALKKLEI